MKKQDQVEYFKKFLIATIKSKTGTSPFVIIKGNNGYVELQTSNGLVTEKFKFRYWETLKPYERLVDQLTKSLCRHSGINNQPEGE